MKQGQLVSRAKRLVLDGHVREIGEARVYRVRGDHDSYDCIVFDGENYDANFCTCPAAGSCSHLLAAQYEADRTDCTT